MATDEDLEGIHGICAYCQQEADATEEFCGECRCTFVSYALLTEVLIDAFDAFDASRQGVVRSVWW